MMRCNWWALFLAVSLGLPCLAAEGKYSIKTDTVAIPKELKEPIGQLLGDNAIILQDDKGTVLAEIWLRKQLPSKATPEQIKNGLTYRELEETTLVGAVRFAQQTGDYRKQKIKPGVYTLRLGFQPMDGDHMGTAPYPEFCLVVPADIDQKPDTMSAKELQEMSSKAAGTSHPGVFLLFPNNKPDDAPKLEDKGEGKWAVSFKEEVVSGSNKGVLGFSLTLIGHTDQ
jgi:hypothetical protein